MNLRGQEFHPCYSKWVSHGNLERQALVAHFEYFCKGKCRGTNQLLESKICISMVVLTLFFLAGALQQMVFAAN